MFDEKAMFILALFILFVAFSQMVTSPDKRYAGLNLVGDDNMKQTLIEAASIVNTKNTEKHTKAEHKEWDINIRPYLEDHSFGDFRFERKYTDPNEVVPIISKNGSETHTPLFFVDGNATHSRDSHSKLLTRGNNHHHT